MVKKRNIWKCRKGHRRVTGSRRCGKCNAEVQAAYRREHPEQEAAAQAKYYARGGAEKKTARWKKFQAACQALDPGPDEDHGYAS